MDGLITGLLVAVIDIYIVLLFMRIFVTERERYDSVLGLVFTATDPIIGQLRPLLPWGSVSVTALIVIVVLLLLKVLLGYHILMVLRGVADTLLQLYVLIIIITATVREYYTNPIANLAQRLIRPVHAVAAQVVSHPMAINVVSVGLLVLAHAIVRLILRDLMDGSGPEFFIISSLHLIVNLTVFFTYVIVINALLSWVSPDPLNPIVQLLTLIAAPITDPIRRVVPPLGGAIDISPLLAILVLFFANGILHSFLDVVQQSLQ
jgi:YggT family protein